MKSHEIWGHIGGHFWVLGLIYDKVGRSQVSNRVNALKLSKHSEA